MAEKVVLDFIADRVRDMDQRLDNVWNEVHSLKSAVQARAEEQAAANRGINEQFRDVNDRLTGLEAAVTAHVNVNKLEEDRADRTDRRMSALLTYLQSWQFIALFLGGLMLIGVVSEGTLLRYLGVAAELDRIEKSPPAPAPPPVSAAPPVPEAP